MVEWEWMEYTNGLEPNYQESYFAHTHFAPSWIHQILLYSTLTAKLIQSKIPEIEKSLKLVLFLKAKESAEETTLTTRYNLADMLYAKASIDCASGIVNLWLGANVMLEYTYDEAIDLLKTKLDKAKKDLFETSEGIDLVRKQIITAEVKISRI